MQLSPLPGHVYIEHIEPIERRSTLVLPETISRDERSGGRIVATAGYKPIPVTCCADCCPNFVEGMDQAPMSVTVGQYAIFKPRSADVLSIKGRTFFSVREDDLLATMDEAAFNQLTV